jgi:hypothetical protein
MLYSWTSYTSPLFDPDILLKPYSQTFSEYNHPLMWHNKFHNLKIHEVKFTDFYLLIFRVCTVQGNSYANVRNYNLWVAIALTKYCSYYDKEDGWMDEQRDMNFI